MFKMNRYGLLTLSIAMLGVAVVGQAVEDTIAIRTTVGLPVVMEQQVLPGPQRAAKAMENRHDPVVVRIRNVYPHGTDFRYDIEVYALEPGKYNLADYLVPTGSEDPDSLPPLPPLWLEVESTIEEGLVVPNDLSANAIDSIGGYRRWMIGLGIVWLLGLGLLIFYPRPSAAVVKSESIVPLTMADRLRPLVRAAREQRLDPVGKAELERTVIAYWCKRLGLQHHSPERLMDQLKKNPQAAPLLLAMENWFHAPQPDQTIDLENLLIPYEDIVEPELAKESISNPDQPRSSLEKTAI